MVGFGVFRFSVLSFRFLARFGGMAAQQRKGFLVGSKISENQRSPIYLKFRNPFTINIYHLLRLRKSIPVLRIPLGPRPKPVRTRRKHSASVRSPFSSHDCPWEAVRSPFVGVESPSDTVRTPVFSHEATPQPSQAPFRPAKALGTSSEARLRGTGFQPMNQESPTTTAFSSHRHRQLHRLDAEATNATRLKRVE